MLLAPLKSSILGRVRSRSTGWIGVDIGAGAVKLAQLDRRDDRWQLSKMALVPWSNSSLSPTGGLTAATISNGRLAALVRQAVASCGFFQGRQAAAVLSPSACELLSLEVPSAPEPELREMIGQELAAQRDGAGEGTIDEFEFDYWDAHPSAATSDQGFAPFNVLGLRRDLAEQAGTEIFSAGLALRELDGTPFTLARALSLAVSDASQTGAVAMLDWGHAGAMFAVIVDGQPIFARTLRDCGCVRLSQAVAAALNLSDVEAWHLLSTCGVPSEASRGSTAHDLQEFVADLLRGPVDEILAELNKTLAFLKHQAPDLAPHHVWLCGGGATVKNIDEHLEAGLGVAVRNWRLSASETAHAPDGDRHALPAELFANAAALSLLGASP